jgi:hypothetical protein
VATGQVTNQRHPRHRHQEFLGFLKQVARTYPRRVLQVICDNQDKRPSTRGNAGRRAFGCHEMTSWALDPQILNVQAKDLSAVLLSPLHRPDGDVRTSCRHPFAPTTTGWQLIASM